MQIQSLNCNNCGAQLQVPDVAKFVTCSHCGSQLAIRRSDSIWYTEKIEQLVETTSEIGEQVARLAYRAELDRIDAAWEREQIDLEPPGDMTPHDRKVAWIGMTVMGLITVILGPFMGQVEVFGGVGLVVMVVAGIVYSLKSANDAKFEQAHVAYLRRRGSVHIDDFRPQCRQDA